MQYAIGKFIEQKIMQILRGKNSGEIIAHGR